MPLRANTAEGGVLTPKRLVVYRGHGICVGKWKLADGTAKAWDITFQHWPSAMQMSTEQARALRDALVAVLGDTVAQ